MDQNNPNGHTKEQWVSFAMLLIFGVSVVVLGIVQMRNTIYNPLAIDKDDGSKQKEAVSIYENDQVKLQSLDTDHDGLNDYEEIEFFATSPYLPDTDSDGLTDKQEIDQKTDPLCPKGENCNKVKEVPEDSILDKGIKPMFAEEVVPGLGSGQAPRENPFVNDKGEVDLQQFITDPKKLREMLRQSGSLSEEDLAKIDDASLEEIANKIYKEKFMDIKDLSPLAGDGAPTKTAPADTNFDLKKIIDNPTELRAMMLQSGAIKAEQLDKIDDATLKQMAQKIYKDQFSNSAGSSNP
jgi:hypothetical protein